MQDWQNYIGEALTGIISAGITWFFSRRKQELELTQQAITIWRETSMELKAEIRSLQEEMNEMRQKMTSVETENEKLRQENITLKKEQETLKKRLAQFERKHGE